MLWGLHASNAEPSIEYHTCDACQDLACLFCSEVGHIAWHITSVCSWEIDYIEAVTPFWDYHCCLTALAFFSGYGIAVPVQSADSSPTTVALKVKRCHMLDFLDHLRTIWQWAHSQKIQWAFSVLYHLWYCWVLKWHSQKINSERFLTLYPLLFPVPHTLMRQFGHLMWLTQERVNSNSSWLHWVSDQYNSGTKIIWTFWENLGFYPNIFFP
jgi:hypothetical protein